MTEKTDDKKSPAEERNWCEIQEGKVELFKFQEKKDYISGYYIGFQPNVGKYNTNLHQVLSGKGLIKFWGSYQLDYKLSSIIPGLFIKIVYGGEVQNEDEKSRTRLYSVQVDSERYQQVLDSDVPF